MLVYFCIFFLEPVYLSALFVIAAYKLFFTTSDTCLPSKYYSPRYIVVFSEAMHNIVVGSSVASCKWAYNNFHNSRRTSETSKTSTTHSQPLYNL